MVRTDRRAAMGGSDSFRPARLIRRPRRYGPSVPADCPAGRAKQEVQEQTSLLAEQNTKLDLQNVTAEAQRRSAFSTELFSILQSVSQLEAQSDGTTAQGTAL